MKKLFLLAMVIGLFVLISSISQARDIVEFDTSAHIIWMNPVAWDTLNLESKQKICSDWTKLPGSWDVKAMGSGLLLAKIRYGKYEIIVN
jgi:hypothetical protein